MYKKRFLLLATLFGWILVQWSIFDRDKSKFNKVVYGLVRRAYLNAATESLLKYLVKRAVRRYFH